MKKNSKNLNHSIKTAHLGNITFNWNSSRIYKKEWLLLFIYYNILIVIKLDKIKIIKLKNFEFIS